MTKMTAETIAMRRTVILPRVQPTSFTAQTADVFSEISCAIWKMIVVIEVTNETATERRAIRRSSVVWRVDDVCVAYTDVMEGSTA